MLAATLARRPSAAGCATCAPCSCRSRSAPCASRRASAASCRPFRWTSTSAWMLKRHVRWPRRTERRPCSSRTRSASRCGRARTAVPRLRGLRSAVCATSAAHGRLARCAQRLCIPSAHYSGLVSCSTRLADRSPSGAPIMRSEPRSRHPHCSPTRQLRLRQQVHFLSPCSDRHHPPLFSLDRRLLCQRLWLQQLQQLQPSRSECPFR